MLLSQKLSISGVAEFQGPLPTGRFEKLSDVVTVALPYLFPIAGILLFGYLVWGGFDYLLAMGDPKKAEAGRTKITNAIIGFVIIFSSFWITQIVDYVFKLHIYTP